MVSNWLVWQKEKDKFSHMRAITKPRYIFKLNIVVGEGGFQHPKFWSLNCKRICILHPLLVLYFPSSPGHSRSHVLACAGRTSWSRTELPCARRCLAGQGCPAATLRAGAGLAVAGQAASSTASLVLPVRERKGCAAPQHHDPGRAGSSLAPHTGQRESGTEWMTFCSVVSPEELHCSQSWFGSSWAVQRHESWIHPRLLWVPSGWERLPTSVPTLILFTPGGVPPATTVPEATQR